MVTMTTDICQSYFYIFINLKLTTKMKSKL